MIQGMDNSSLFFITPEIPATEVHSTLKLIHSSERGFCDIFRIDRGGRFRALKCLKPDYRGDALYENILRKEFEIGYSLDHPNICEYYSLTNVEGLGNCIEMEWVDGRSLEDLLNGAHPSKELMDHILDGICDALSYLHSKQIIHRDLKPSNIMVTYKGDNVRLIDFGLSDSDAHSILKAPAGTIDYTAPEVLKGENGDVRSDIYSLGVIMFRMSRKYRFIARKCCETRPNARYTSANAVKKAIHSNAQVVSGVLFILLAAFIVLWSLWNGAEKENAAVPEMVEEVPVVIPERRDSIVTETTADETNGDQVQQAVEAAPVRQAPAAAPKNDSVDASVIDELFRQATDLFE